MAQILVRLRRSLDAPADRLANLKSRKCTPLTSTDASEVIVGLGCEIYLDISSVALDIDTKTSLFLKTIITLAWPDSAPGATLRT